jgi:hypothetical protein
VVFSARIVRKKRRLFVTLLCFWHISPVNTRSLVF